MERAYIRWVRALQGMFLATVDGRDYLLGAEEIGPLVDWLAGAAPAPPLDAPARLRPQRDRRLRRAQSLVRRHGVTLNDRSAGLDGGFYLNVGHQSLTDRMDGLLRMAGLRTAVMIHDTIPLDHPDLSGRGSPRRFRTFLEVAGRADVVIANSQDTAVRLGRYLNHPPVVVAPLGIDPAPAVRPRSAPTDGPSGRPDPAPAFVCVGTIEPRKNHALLLDVWARLGPAAPLLRIIGRRGWGNEATFRRLDTDPAIGRSVHELGPLGDSDRAAEIAAARALLFPSLAEGYGLPVAEALATGTPVIASDLPALRELAGDVPEYLPPDDADAWCAAIRAYTDRPSPDRDAQIARLSAWEPPTWDAHFAIIRDTLGLPEPA